MLKITIKILFVFFYFCLFTFGVYGQSITWQRFYDGPAQKGDIAYDICKISDGNYCVVGYSENINSRSGIYVMKVNQYGDTIWTYYFGGFAPGRSGRSVVATDDGGCVLTGTADSSFTIKMSSDGNVVWYKKYNTQFPFMNRIIRANDGGYIACGYLGLNGFAFKVDSMGNRLWERVYNHLNSIYFSSIVQAIDSGYIIAGGFLENDTGKTLLLKINESGDIIWTQKFIAKSFIGTECTNIERVNNTYIIAGYTIELLPGNQTFRRNYFARANSDGEVYFSRVLGFQKSNTLITFKTLSSNRLLFCGSYDSATFITNVKAVLTDSSGNIYLQKNISNGFLDLFNSVLPVDYGDIIFCGLSRQQTTNYDIYIVRSDSNLNFPPPISVGHTQEIIPILFNLYQNYPNPFNSETKIKIELPQSCQANLNIYDILGREIYKIEKYYPMPGVYEITWNAANFASGIYFVTLLAGTVKLTRKIALLK